MIQLSIDTENKELLKAIRAILKFSGVSYSEKVVETKMTRRQFHEKLDSANQEIKDGRFTSIDGKQQLQSFLENL